MPTRIVELSNIIAENTKIVDEYFTRNGLPTPSFEVDGPARIQIPPQEKDACTAHIAVLDATKELNQLLTGAGGIIMSISPNDCVSLHAIYHFKLAQAIPVGQARHFEDLSRATGLNIVDLRRLVRHAMCNRIFCEPRPGVVAHTAASRLLAENQLMYDFAGITTEEKFPAAPKVLEALERFGHAKDPSQSGFSLANDTDKGFYEYLQSQPQRNQRWAGAMNAFAATVPLDGVLSKVDWESFGQGTVVDVGGAWGPVSVAVAKRFPDLKFIVQDFPTTVAEGPEKIPGELQDRISFVAHDFLEPQPVSGADVYLFRAIFHNYPDDSCIRILRNQIPALKPGARLVIIDSCLHEPNSLPATVEKRRRSMDLSMLTWFGSRERYVDEWRAIFEAADQRFHLRSVESPPGDMNKILEVEWMG